LPEEILTSGEGQVRGLIGIAGNMVLSMADGKKSEEALQHLQFMVSIDFYLNETTRFADVILPPIGPLEKSHCDLFYHLYDTINWYKYSPPLFEPEKPGYTDWDILMQLLKRWAVKRADSPVKKALYAGLWNLADKLLSVETVLALGIRFGPYGNGVNPFKKDALSLQKLKENPHGIFLGNLEKSLPDRLFTKDKKIHIAPQVLLDDIPRLRARFVDGGEEALRANSEHDLRMISRLTNRTLGWMHHSYRLVKGKNPVALLIHSSDAAARRIDASSVVKVSSRRGSVELPVEITEHIMPGVVCMPHLWGHNRPGTRQRVANATPGVSMNDLTDISVIDELTGNAVVNGVPVKVELVASAGEREDLHPDESVEEFVA
jgi:anaerobic selenocysteine-containing dehydrogenase